MIPGRSFSLAARQALLSIAIAAATPAFAAGPAATPPDRAGMQRRLAACATCHGKQGQGDMGREGGVYPRLAGQPSEYLYRQLLRFKSAERTGIPPVTTMHRLLENLPRPYLRLIADFYRDASPAYEPPPAKKPALWQQGHALVRQGLPDAHIAACTSCHGADLEGEPPATPALAGQYARYLTVQFEHWAQGARHDRLHERIAHTLTIGQIQAMSHYLASLRPAAKGGGR